MRTIQYTDNRGLLSTLILFFYIAFFAYQGYTINLKLPINMGFTGEYFRFPDLDARLRKGNIMVEYPDTLFYEKNHAIIFNDIANSLYYYFDYDDRSYEINMDFQHFHSFFEIHILLSPKAVHLIEGVPYELLPYDLVLLKPSILHKTEYPQGEPSKRLIINFLYPEDYFNHKEAFETILEPFYDPKPVFRFEKEQRQVLFQQLNEIFLLSQKELPESLKKLMIHQKFIEFLYHLKDNWSHNIYTSEKAVNESDQKIYSITSYIHNHYNEDISLESLSKRFFISSFYLSHQFKKVTGHTLTHYIQMTRIRNTQYLLINTSIKVTEIAQQCGFTSFSQFNRVFRKFCGLSPSEYRKEHPAVKLGLRNA